MQKLSEREEGANEKLVYDLISKAFGVLLWVVIVVGRLLAGLQDYDTMEDLLINADELLTNLENLYAHMVESMSPTDRHQGSKLLQIVRRSTQIHDHWPVTLLQLHLQKTRSTYSQ